MPLLEDLVGAALEEEPLLRRSEGIHVIELRPQVHWHKGRAVEWLLKSMCEQMGLPSGVAERNATVMPIYIGDDVTDEDAFKELAAGRGIPIVVREHAPLRNETAAELYLRDPREVVEFLALFLRDREHAGEGAGPGGGGDGNGEWRGPGRGVPYLAPEEGEAEGGG